MKRVLQIAAVIFLGVAIAHADTNGANDTQQTIRYLLDYVAQSDATFIRNGEDHTGKEAAEHFQAKYDHFKKDIRTPEDFIRLAASKSLMSGKPYLVKTKDGKVVACAEWLGKVLAEYRRSGIGPAKS